jgi:hypothetical protein
MRFPWHASEHKQVGARLFREAHTKAAAGSVPVVEQAQVLAVCRQDRLLAELAPELHDVQAPREIPVQDFAGSVGASFANEHAPVVGIMDQRDLHIRQTLPRAVADHDCELPAPGLRGGGAGQHGHQDDQQVVHQHPHGF